MLKTKQDRLLSAKSVGTKHVLVIDDETDVQEVVRGCLEDIAGWSVVTASSGFEGLERLAEERPNAILLDVMMPGMDGLTFLQHLQANPEYRSIPVILLTAKIGLTESHQFAELGVAGAISKPFNPILLADQMATYLSWDVEA